MADESDPYKQFSDFNYRKILSALMRWEEEEEEGEIKEEEMKEREQQQQQQSVIPIDKRQLIKNFFQKVNDLFPLPPGTTLDSIVVQFYQLKKELMNCDPNWKFMASDIRYIADILPLLDAINIESEKKHSRRCRHILTINFFELCVYESGGEDDLGQADLLLQELLELFVDGVVDGIVVGGRRHVGYDVLKMALIE